MLPVIYKFVFDTELSRLLLYLVGLAVVAYSGWNGWRNATTVDASGKVVDATPDEKRMRALTSAGTAAALVGFALYYALPEVPFLGKGRGEGIPIHTYGILVGGGFIAAVTVSSWLATREWPGELGLKRRDQILDLAFYLFVGGFLGSRELFVLVNWSEYTADAGRRAEAYAVVVDLLVLAALIVGVVFRERLFSSAVQREQLVQRAFRIFISVAIGGRVVFLMLVGRGLGGIIDLASGGLVFYGGLIGAAIAALWYCLANGIEFLRLADIAMPTVSLGQALGRLGCFSAGCCWGEVTTHARTPFAVEFPGVGLVRTLFGTPGPSPSLAFAQYADRAHETRYLVEATGQVSNTPLPGGELLADWVIRHGHTPPVHPTQLYESLGQTLFFVGLLYARRWRRFHGQIFGMWLVAYALLRSTVEAFRGDFVRGTLHGFFEGRGWSELARAVPLNAWYDISVSQFISIGMFSLGTWILVKNLRAVSARPRLDLSTLTVPAAS